MKTLSSLFLLLFVSFNVISQSVDSLKLQRADLYEKYTELNIPGKEITSKEYKEIVGVLKKIIIVDTRIIDIYTNTVGVEIKNLEKEIDSLNSENDELSEKITSTNQTLTIFYVAGGILVVITVLLLILLIMYASEMRKLRANSSSNQV